MRSFSPGAVATIAVWKSAPMRAAPCCCGAGRAAIDRCLLLAGPTAANPPHAAAASEWDGRTPYRYVDPVQHTMRAVTIADLTDRSRCEILGL